VRRPAGASSTSAGQFALTGYFLRDMVPEVALPLEAPEIQELRFGRLLALTRQVLTHFMHEEVTKVGLERVAVGLSGGSRLRAGGRTGGRGARGPQQQNSSNNSTWKFARSRSRR
jgi:hypothetical protein